MEGQDNTFQLLDQCRQLTVLCQEGCRKLRSQTFKEAASDVNVNQSCPKLSMEGVLALRGLIERISARCAQGDPCGSVKGNFLGH